ncbi:hypothetical protein O6H91_Y431000 [Diphasiastrum complanatum]|nr:hypothetical protein O6H91_Y431000 [Diphasiastrum complanatum]
MASHQLDEQSNRLYRIRKTVMQMLRDRDYLVVDHELSLSKEQFREKFGDEPKREDLVISRYKRSDSSERIFVFFPEEAKVGVKTIKTYAERMKSENVHRAILVVQQNLTPFAKQCLSECLQSTTLKFSRKQSYW